MYRVPVTAVLPGLAWLLEPLAVTTFFDRVWGVRHHHVQRCRPGYFDRLVRGQSALDDLLEQFRPAPASVRLVRGPEHRGSQLYRNADGSLDLDRVRSDFADGYTIIVENIERYSRSMSTLTHALEVELNFPTHVNAYLTPPRSTGFLPHYDHHDVLVLQIHGSKSWHVYGDSTVAPQLMQQRYEVDPAGLPTPSDLQLAAGDTLYLPRGRVHAAETASQPSVHLTVGIHVPTVLTLVTHALHLLSVRDERVHTRLPPRYLDDPQVGAGLAGLLRPALDALASPEAIADGLDALQDLLVRRGRCPPVGQSSVATGLDEHTAVVKHQPLYARVRTVPGGVALQFAQLLVSAGAEHEAAMRFLVANTQPFRVGDLPGLTPQQRLALAQSLLVSGFLERV